VNVAPVGRGSGRGKEEEEAVTVGVRALAAVGVSGEGVKGGRAGSTAEGDGRWSTSGSVKFVVL